MLNPDTNPTPHSVRKTRATTTLRPRETPQTPHGRLTPLSDTSHRSTEGPGAPLDERGMHRWRQTARGYLLLPHLAPVLVVELATAAFAVIAWGGLPPAHLLGPLLLAMLGGQL